MKFALKHTPIHKFPSGNGLAETPEELMQALKTVRGWMLSESDWTQTADSPLPDDVKSAWRAWRQELRDITQTINVNNVQDWFEVSDPPTQGLPSTWLSWEYETYNEIMSVYFDVTKENQDAITAQEQANHG